MAVLRATVWIANDILTAVDLNAEFDLFAGAPGQNVSFPRTANADFDGYTLILDAVGTTTLSAAVVDELNLAIGAVDTYRFTATELTILGKRVLTIDDLRRSGIEAMRPIVYENRNRLTAFENSNDAVLAAQSFGF